MHRDLFEQTGIYPHQDGDGQVVVIFAGVAEILTKAEAMRRYEYARHRAEVYASELDMNIGDPVAVKQTTLRAAAYGAAIAYRKPKLLSGKLAYGQHVPPPRSTTSTLSIDK